MQTSIFLAQLIGPAFIVIGLGMLVNRQGYRTVAVEFLGSRALIFLAGLLTLVPGLAIVLVHNVWTADWRIIITLFGWGSLIAGIVRIVAPQKVMAVGSQFLDKSGALFVASGIGSLVVGVVFSYFGYAP